MFYRKAPTKIPIFHGKIDGFRFQFSQQNQSIWVNFITTEPCSPEAWKSWFLYGKSSPFFMAARFRSVKYDNLPRYIPIYPHISWENLWVSWENSLKPIHWKRPNRSIHLWSPTLRRGDSVQRVQPERPSWKGERRPWVGHGMGQKSKKWIRGGKQRDRKNGWNPRIWVNQENRFEWTCWRHPEFYFCL